MAPQATWDAFDPLWRQMLASAPRETPAFHAAHLAHRRKDFCRSDGWTREECDALVVRATDVLTTEGPATNKLCAVGCTVALDEMPGAGTVSPYEIYESCFGVCLYLVVKSFPDVLSGDNTFDLFFDEKDKMRARIGGWIESARSEPSYGKYIGSWGFDSDRKILPLQAADFIAYERRKRTEDRRAGLSRQRRCYIRMRKARPGRFRIMDKRFAKLVHDYAVVKSLGLPPASVVERIPRERD